MSTFKDNKGYVFVSHSHKDLEIVRKIRNKLEENDLDPILFYLHCMDNPNSEEAKELEKLIHKEIDAREYFLYAKSKNSEKSKWVQDELSYIESTNPASVKKLDIEDDFDNVIKELDKIIHDRRVYISYSYADKDFANKLVQAFKEEDFAVWFDQMLDSGQHWIGRIKNEIDESSIQLIIFSKKSVKDNFFRKELQYISNNDKICYRNIIFIRLGDSCVDSSKFTLSADKKRLSLSDNPTYAEIKYLISYIKNRSIDCPWGPSRKMFSINENRPGYHVFNSMIDNPSIGDERNFCRIRKLNTDEWTNFVSVVPGDKYEVIIYYHNNAGKVLDTKLSKYAQHVKVSCNFPCHVKKGEVCTINAKISSSNTNPECVWSGSYISSYDDCKIEYVPDTALIYNGGNLNKTSIGPYYLFRDGSTIGFNKTSGMIQGGFEYAGHIKFQIHVSKI